MNWQEELDQLDRSLAAGQVSADDYRRQRDRILAAASGGQQSAPQNPGAAAEPQQPQQPQGQENRTPFPAPFRWEAVPPNEPTQAVSGQHAAPSEHTQVVGGDAADKTQIVSSDATADRTQVVSTGPQPPNASERTQHIPAIGSGPMQQPPMHQGQPPQQQQQQPPQQQQGWPQDPNNPWANPDEPLSLWSPGFHQGPEIFETTKNKKRSKLPLIIAAVVVVALVAAGVLYFTVFKKNTNDNAGPGPTTTTSAPAPTSTTPPAPKSFGPLAIPDGNTGGGKVYTAAQLASTKPLPTPDLVLLKQAGVTQAQSVIVIMQTSTVSLWSFRSKNAKNLLSSIVDDQKRFGFSEVADAKQGSVDVYTSKQRTSDGSTIVAFRAHYVSGSDVIRVESFDKDEAAAKSNFTTALTAQLQHNPPA